MSIGIMDQDMAVYTLVPFNLEAMKLSAYYKKQHEIVSLTTNFTPDKHQKFYYLKDYDDGIFPLNLNQNNVTYSGLAFSNNIYRPLPIEIEKQIPDTTLYGRMESLIKGDVKNPKRKKIFDNMMTSEHCRLSLDGKTIWPEYRSQFKFLAGARNLMFHDYDLGAIEGGFEEVQKILKTARTDGWATKVGMKFPVQIYDGKSLLNWSSLNTNSTFYSIQYNGIIDDNTFIEWIGRIRDRAVFTQIDYMVTAGQNYEDFINNTIIKLFHQILVARASFIFFSLKFEENFFKDRRWEAVINLLNYYHTSYAGHPKSMFINKVDDDTMFDFVNNLAPDATYYPEFYTVDQIRQIFAFVREANYNLFKEFYELTARKLGGRP